MLFALAFTAHASVTSDAGSDVGSKYHSRRLGWTMVNPGAGMNPAEGLTTVYKDGYFHLRCMFDKMQEIADYHNELTRVHEYKVQTNVSIVRYTDRVHEEQQEPMTPRICFNFCRTVPDMLYFGLSAGRKCYCSPYYKQGPGDGVCDAGCAGDSSVTCGNTKGMSDVYEMHACSDTIAEAKKDAGIARKKISDVNLEVELSAKVLTGLKAATDEIDTEEIREGIMQYSTFINEEKMSVEATVTECLKYADETEKLANAVPEDTLDWSKIEPIEVAQTNMNRCTDATVGDKKSLTEMLDSPDLEGLLAAADLDLNAVLELAGF
jgi:hypothetical protein